MVVFDREVTCERDETAVVMAWLIEGAGTHTRFALRITPQYAEAAWRIRYSQVGVATKIWLHIDEFRELVARENANGRTDLRVFISHISEHKDKATRLKTCLTPYGISGFVAHEDILPTLEWQHEIERALYAMDAFIAIHTKGFSQSFWTQQEIGFAYARGVKIISLKMGEDPTGFISKQQALARRDRTAEQIAEEVDALLADDERTAMKLANAKNARGIMPPAGEIPF